MFLLSDLFRDYLIVFLEASFVALGVLFAYVLVRHAVGQLAGAARARPARALPAGRRRRARRARRRPSSSRPSRGWRRRRRATCPDIGALLITPLRVASGSPVDAARAAATRLGLIERWKKDLGAHAWWRQAEAARALGLVRAEGALRPLLACLDDAHEEVRAAAVEALGHLGDPGCVPALLRALPDASRHQRARVVESIRELGPGVAHALIAHARVHPDDLATVAELIGFTGAANAARRPAGVVEPRRPPGAGRGAAGAGLARARRPRLLLRAARARRRERRGAGDGRAGARAIAARQTPRRTWPQHLGDEWLVAAHAATSLRMLGPAGERELVARQDAPGLAGVLARQMLWERRARPEAGGRHEGASSSGCFSRSSSSCCSTSSPSTPRTWCARCWPSSAAPASPPLDHARARVGAAVAGDAGRQRDRAGLQRAGDHRREHAVAAAAQLPAVRGDLRATTVRRTRRLRAPSTAFDLVEAPMAVGVGLPTAKVRAIYRSLTHAEFVLVDKENGGRADALNAGINAARYPLICLIDADSLLEPSALTQAVLPFLESPDTLGVGGIIRVVNGCKVEAGRVTEVRVPGELDRALPGGRVPARLPGRPRRALGDGRAAHHLRRVRRVSAARTCSTPAASSTRPSARTWSCACACIASCANGSSRIGWCSCPIRCAGRRCPESRRHPRQPAQPLAARPVPGARLSPRNDPQPALRDRRPAGAAVLRAVRGARTDDRDLGLRRHRSAHSTTAWSTGTTPS